MIRIILIRHGQTDYNKLHMFQGQFDSKLTELGFAQAELAAKRVAAEYSVDAIYSSDLSRAVNTANAVARAVGLDSITTDPAFREVNVGRWMHQKVSDALKSDPDLAKEQSEQPGRFRYPGGETLLEVYERAMAKILEIAEGNDGKTIAIVSHGGTIRSLVKIWLGYDIDESKNVPSMGNTAISVFEYNNGSFTPVIVGDSSHLPEDMK